MYIVGIDIGGANVKAADTDGRAISRGFEIWKSPQLLKDVLTEILSQFPTIEHLAVTMTAELADCFATKADGVDFILAAVETAAENRPIAVWQTGAEFVDPTVARDIPLLVAAANWHALATWVGRMVPESTSLLIDVGTTTTDIVPLSNGVPIPRGMTDVERLQLGELVYTGVRRTPVCAIAPSVTFRDQTCPLAAEVFATTLDVYLMLGEIAEEVGNGAKDNRETANGKPATREAAHDRLARMLCCDRTELTRDDAFAMAQVLALAQRELISSALTRVIDRQATGVQQVLVSGAGAFLARKVVAAQPNLASAQIIDLDQMFDAETSSAACAMAVARLAAERLPV